MEKIEKTDKLSRMREAIGKLDLGGSKGFWSPKDGRNVIRILPGVGKMEDLFCQTVGRHYIPGDHATTHYCPKITSGDDAKCPICEAVSELYAAGDENSKELAGKLRVRRQYWMNVIVRGMESSGPQIFTPGPKIMEDLVDLLRDPDYGDITDPETGYDVIITRSGSGLQTEYRVKPASGSTPLSKNDDEVERWLDAAKDLTPVELTDNPEEDAKLTKGKTVWYLTYKRLAKEFNIDDISDEEEEEEEKPKKRSLPSKDAKKWRFDEDDDEDIDDDEDEDDDLPPRRTIRRK